MEVLRRADVDEIEIRPGEQGRRVGVSIIGSQPARDAAELEPFRRRIGDRDEAIPIGHREVGRDVVTEGDVAAPDQPDPERILDDRAHAAAGATGPIAAAAA